MTADQTRAATSNTAQSTPEIVTAAQMRRALERGEATPLSQLITDHVRYGDHWWCAYQGDWFRITDQELINFLNKRREWAASGLYLGGRSTSAGHSNESASDDRPV